MFTTKYVLMQSSIVISVKPTGMFTIIYVVSIHVVTLVKMLSCCDKCHLSEPTKMQLCSSETFQVIATPLWHILTKLLHQLWV